MAAAATEIGLRPGTMSISTALRAMWVAARCTEFGKSRNKNQLRRPATSEFDSPVLTEIRTEPRHKVRRCDQVHRRLQRLQRQLEATADLLLTDLADRANLLERTRHTLLSACDVQAGRRFGVIGTALQIFAIVDLFEQIVGAVHDRLGQVDAIGHRADLLESRNQCTIRAAHVTTILILGGCGERENSVRTTSSERDECATYCQMRRTTQHRYQVRSSWTSHHRSIGDFPDHQHETDQRPPFRC
jgi:hypothetical protein